MRRLSHRPKPATVGWLIAASARRLTRARVHFGHGTDNARDEAAALVWHALRLPQDAGSRAYARRVSREGAIAVRELVGWRIAERVPAVYLTGRTRFAGLPFLTDPRALIPRSPIAELIEARFRPWIEPRRVRRLLDLGTGSGCIAVACAKAFPAARVDATDVSAAALSLARDNIRMHRVGRRVHCRISDHFEGLRGRRYDIIVSNPPYVGARELARLPPEYRHEPRQALAGGPDGLDSVRAILSNAGRHLRRGGILVVEVGNGEARLRRAYPRLPFVWPAFERGGGGVFLLRAEDLVGS